MRWLALVLAVVPVPALALSCLPWGVTDAFLKADAADESYLIVYGELSFDPDRLPQVDPQRQDEVPPMTRIAAVFDGAAMVRRGADVPFAAPVTLEIACFGPWCARPMPGQVLAFLRKDGDTYALSDNPCGGFLFGAPRTDQLRSVRSCLRGQSCEPLGTR